MGRGVPALCLTSHFHAASCAASMRDMPLAICNLPACLAGCLLLTITPQVNEPGPKRGVFTPADAGVDDQVNTMLLYLKLHYHTIYTIQHQGVHTRVLTELSAAAFDVQARLALPLKAGAHSVYTLYTIYYYHTALRHDGGRLVFSLSRGACCPLVNLCCCLVLCLRVRLRCIPRSFCRGRCQNDTPERSGCGAELAAPSHGIPPVACPYGFPAWGLLAE